jgi:hypothetical protein
MNKKKHFKNFVKKKKSSEIQNLEFMILKGQT